MPVTLNSGTLTILARAGTYDSETINLALGQGGNTVAMTVGNQTGTFTVNPLPASPRPA